MSSLDPLMGVPYVREVYRLDAATRLVVALVELGIGASVEVIA